MSELLNYPNAFFLIFIAIVIIVAVTLFYKKKRISLKITAISIGFVLLLSALLLAVLFFDSTYSINLKPILPNNLK